jgi:DNA-binding MarR family transcriptional regulator
MMSRGQPMILRKQDMMQSTMGGFYAFAAALEQALHAAMPTMSYEESALLLHLKQVQQPQTPSQLSEYLLVAPSTMSNRLAKLEKQGWLVRLSHPTITSSRWVSLTATGDGLATALNVHAFEVIDPFLDAFRPKQQWFLLQLLQTYTRLTRGGLIEHAAVDWTMNDRVLYAFLQLRASVEWAMMNKNPIPVTFHEARLLNHLFLAIETKQNSVQSLALMMDVSRSRCSDMIASLIHKGLVDSTAGETDARHHYITFTEEASHRFHAFTAIQGRWVDQRINKPNIRELIQFFIVINKFTQYYKRKPI